MLLSNSSVACTPEARKVLDDDRKLQTLILIRSRLKEKRTYWNNKEKEITDEVKDLKGMLKSLQNDLPKALAKSEAVANKLKVTRVAVKQRRRLVLREAYAKAHQSIRKRLGLPNLKSIDEIITEMEREDNENNGLIQNNAGGQGTEV